MTGAPFHPREVRIAGSTSNLGPGFDFLGLAIALELHVRLEPLASASTRHELLRAAGEARTWPDDSTNRLFVAFDRAREALGGEPLACGFAVDSEIPVGRGFGSSGAAVAAGLWLGAASLGREPEASTLLPLGIEIEGHPDNVTASLLGGLTLCHPDAGPDATPLALGAPLAPSLGVALAWPDYELPTPRARTVLPESVPFADAVENPRRLALLLAGLETGEVELLAAGGADRLHVPHRIALLPGAADALAAARAAGAPLATISGAGSGLVAIAPRDATERVAEAMREAWVAHAEGEVEARSVEPALAGPVLV